MEFKIVKLDYNTYNQNNKQDYKLSPIQTAAGTFDSNYSGITTEQLNYAAECGMTILTTPVTGIIALENAIGNSLDALLDGVSIVGDALFGTNDAD